MRVFYNVRLKLSSPEHRSVFVDGIFAANDVLHDVEPTKQLIKDRAMAQYKRSGLPTARVEVVLFRRSKVGFILSDIPQDLENPK